MDNEESEQFKNDLFRSRLQKHLHDSGYSQKALAEAISLHPKVLGRKLNGSHNAYLTHIEVRNIIVTLARWHAIATQEEVFQLLEAAHVEPTVFHNDEWQTAPLSMLATRNSRTLPQPLFAAPVESLVLAQHNLPARTTQLVGREEVVAQLLRLARRDTVRLITLMGPGGCGKTRLALQVASELISEFTEGAWFVPLVEVNDPDLVPMYILKALHIESAPDRTPMHTLISYLQNKQLLLLLDNCEQLQATAIIHPISEILAAAPDVKILVTSRFRLHLYGEYEFGVPLLDFPPPDAKPDAAEFATYAAIRLFVERAQARLPDFVLINENAAIVAQICARVDGLPIALELAAARVKVLPLPLLLEKLSDTRLQVLTNGAKNLPERLQTLRNTIDWSYNLLSLSEQTWFRWLGIFPGDFSLEMIETLMQSFAKDEEHTTTPESVLDFLEHLVNSSLLLGVTTADNQVHFIMLETLREYALEKLSAHNELDKLRDWHTRFYKSVST